MVFERIVKSSYNAGGLDPMSISVTKNHIGFGRELVKFLDNPEVIEVYINREDNEVGFVGATGEGAKSKGYAFTCDDKKQAIAGKFVRSFPVGRYPAKIDYINDMIVVKLPEIAKGIVTEKRRV